MILCRNQRGSTVVVVFLAVAVVAAIPSFSAEDGPKRKGRTKETCAREAASAVPAAKAKPVATAKMDVPFTSKAVLLGTNRDGEVIVGMIVQNKSPRAIWLPKMFESVNLRVHLSALHMDGGLCRFPQNYFKLEPGKFHVYDIDLPYKTLRPTTYELVLCAPAREKSDNGAGEVIVERIRAELDLGQLSAIIKSTEGNIGGK